ncbi:MAG: large subunit ribosomal protein L9 [Candidatus Paceibacteria bacterium]|jgi:large subunit ribosomal protein L9
MKVILLQDVAKIGKRSELVEVPDGYAMNQLIPKGMAEAATPANKNRIDKLQASVKANKAAEEARFESAHKALSEKVIKIVTEVNEQGHLFKAVNEFDIADAAMTAGIDVDTSMIMIGDPIKEVGEHVVGLARGINKGEFTIEVTKK